MSIAMYIGMPGECKTYSLTDWVAQQMRRKRAAYSQYSIMGAGRLYKLSDLEHTQCRNAAVAVDEVARILPARDWTNEDAVESHVLEIHRHYGQDIRGAAQNPMQCSVTLRRLVERWIYCYRVGWAEPSGLISAGIRPKWWQMPIAVRQVEYYADDVGADGKPLAKPGNRPIIRYRWFRREVAELYDTTQRVMPGSLKLDIEDRLEGAEVRLAEKWIVVRGKCTNGDDVNLERGRDEYKRGRKIVKQAEEVAAKAGLSFQGGEGEDGGDSVIRINPRRPDLPGGADIRVSEEIDALVQAWEDEPPAGTGRRVRVAPNY